MALIIKGVEKVAVGTGAVSVETACRSFLLANAGAGAVYFRDAGEDGRAVTTETGFPLTPGQTTALPLCARRLSLIGAAETDVRILYVREE